MVANRDIRGDMGIIKTAAQQAKLFMAYFAACFISASAIYQILHLIMPKGYVFGALYRMFLYHEVHPEQYIAIVSAAYGFSALIWTFRFGKKKGFARYFSMLAMMFLAIAIASPVGGILWTFHDMQVGFFPDRDVMINHFCDGAVTGLEIGWLIILLSIPYNLIGIVGGIFVTDFIQKRFAVAKPPSS